MRAQRIAQRRKLRARLGNAKQRAKELMELGMRMYLKGLAAGQTATLGKLHNSVAGLDYGEGYYVAPTVETSGPSAEYIAAAGARLDAQPIPDSPCGGASGSSSLGASILAPGLLSSERDSGTVGEPAP